jgi:hypothetical protein
MLKLQTPVEFPQSSISISLSNRTMILGSCFADSVGALMKDAGMNVCVNPFGTLYNPQSILSAIRRLYSGGHFTESDCVQLGAGAGLVCSFSHHTSFARPDAREFLADANAALDEAAAFWKSCDRVLVTLGTAHCWLRADSGEVVSNCLKRPAAEFVRKRLSCAEVSQCLTQMLELGSGKKFIFTVSPIRHLSDGAHANQLSKSILLLSIDEILQHFTAQAEYFPSYEILLDELRDYRFYAEDMTHPSPQAVRWVWERFCDFAVPPSERERLAANERASLRARHRPILHK